MLHLQKQTLPHIHSASPIFLPLRRALLAATAGDGPPRKFAVEDYLITTCGLTRQQAVKSAPHISHQKSPSKADAVLAFLAGPALRLSKADIADVVARDPLILNCSLEKTLEARVASIRAYGFSDDQLQSLFRLSPFIFRSFNINEKLGFWIPFLGSPEKLLYFVKRNYYLLTADLEGTIKPNIGLLRQCGLSVRDIAKLCVPSPRLLTSKQETLKAILARSDQLGVPRHSPIFWVAVATTASLSADTMAAKFKLLSETLGWSQDEVASVVRKNPVLLTCSGEKLRRMTEFLTTVVGIDAKFILRRSLILNFSLERRLVPRHYVMKVLQEKGLMSKDKCFFRVAEDSEKLFEQRYIQPHKDVLPDLADAYAAARKGELPKGYISG